jgi:hypothetical protein
LSSIGSRGWVGDRQAPCRSVSPTQRGGFSRGCLCGSRQRNIEPTKEDKQNAPLAHNEVSDALADDPVIQGWGFKRLLIGSYKRQVSIRRIKDVDVFGRLTALDDEVLPSTLLSEFERVLKKAFPPVDGATRVRRQARSLQVCFAEYDGLYVDAVPRGPGPLRSASRHGSCRNVRTATIRRVGKRRTPTS